MPTRAQHTRRIVISANKIFVGNLNFETRQDELEKLFGEVGEIAEVFIPTDRNTGRPRGFAFVTFAEDGAAQEAIEKFDGHELGGRNLRINEAEARPPRAPRPPSFNSGGGGWGDSGGTPPWAKPSKPKGSRRNARGKKRSL